MLVVAAFHRVRGLLGTRVVGNGGQLRVVGGRSSGAMECHAWRSSDGVAGGAGRDILAMQDFEKLRAWQSAHALSLRIDAIVRRLPRRGSVAAKAQLSRAADSIPTNIAEGCGAASQREFARYLDIAIKSSSETQYHLIAIRDRQPAQGEACNELVDEASQIRRMLYALRKRVLSDLGS